MQIFRLFFLGFLLLLLASCEKNIADEGQDSVQTAGITEGDRKNALTVAQAQQVAAGTQICVKGYMVASTQKSMSNTDFFSPFEGSTAIVLADKRSDNDLYEEDLFPVCLTDASKGIRDAYNLEAHPEYHNQFVYILGTREQYLSTAGLKKVKGIEIDPNHVVTPDEPGDEPDTPENPDTPDTPENPDNPDNPVTPDNPDNPSTPTSNVLTVAEAKKVKKGTITVKGYIVGAGGSSFQGVNLEFSEPFTENAYILLADKQCDNTSTFDINTELLPISLIEKDNPTIKNIRESLNLVDHSNYQNKLIQIKGSVVYQLKTYGLYKIESYQWITP